MLSTPGQSPSWPRRVLTSWRCSATWKATSRRHNWRIQAGWPKRSLVGWAWGMKNDENRGWRCHRQVWRCKLKSAGYVWTSAYWPGHLGQLPVTGLISVSFQEAGNRIIATVDSGDTVYQSTTHGGSCNYSPIPSFSSNAPLFKWVGLRIGYPQIPRLILMFIISIAMLGE